MNEKNLVKKSILLPNFNPTFLKIFTKKFIGF